MAKKIENTNAPISDYIPRLETDCSGDVAKLKDEANEAIERFSKFPATKENCTKLKGAIDGVLIDLFDQPKSDESDKLFYEISDILKTLMSVIDPEKNFNEQSGWAGLIKREYNRQETFKCLWERKPIVTDKNTLEGYVRAIPNINGMSFEQMMKCYFNDFKTVEKFVKPNQGEGPNAYASRAEKALATTYVYVQRTTKRT